VQAVISGAILLLSQISETTVSAYQILVDATNILYFIPFLYMYAAVIKLAYRPDRETSTAALIPGGKAGVVVRGRLGIYYRSREHHSFGDSAGRDRQQIAV
jgi:amino acid transporter